MEKNDNTSPIETWSFPTSFAQQRLWFLDQLEPGIPIYTLFDALHLQSPLNLTALEQSVNEVVRRHESLRTCFQAVDGTPMQIIAAFSPQPLPIADLSSLPHEHRLAEAKRLAEQQARQPFDLSIGPLFRAFLVKLDDADHLLLLTMHHIISDGWSLGVLMKELGVLYDSYSQGHDSPLAELPIQYADYAVWQRQWLQGEVLEEQLGYWRQQLAGAPAVLELPTDRPRPPVQNYRGAYERAVLPKELCQALQELSRREGVTLFMSLLAAFQVLLYRYSHQPDIVVGIPIAGRNRVETENLIGYFANTLPLRGNLRCNPSFREFLKRVKEMALEAYAHQDVPFEKIVEELQPERSLSYGPLVQVLFALENTPKPTLTLPGMISKTIEVDRNISRADLSFFFSEQASELSLQIEYSTDLFNEERIRRMVEHYKNLLKSIIAHPQQRITELEILTVVERRQLLIEWNGTQAEHDSKTCIHQLFEQQADLRPDAVAVVYDNEKITYGELDRRANQLAHYLAQKGIGPDHLVGICIERGLEMVVGLLGILKAGAAYVPLDPAYPQERLAFMIEDADLKVLLTQQHLSARLPQHTCQVIALDQQWQTIAQQSHRPLDHHRSPDNLAYVIYTSGSTGKPKGVAIAHRCVTQLLSATQDCFHFDNLDVWSLFHSFAFDFSVWEIWGCLLHGGRLVIIPLTLTQTPAALYECLRLQQVTVLNQTPSAIRQLLEVRRQADAARQLRLRLVICGGEALPREVASELLAWEVPLWNFYGPTESTVWAAIKPVEAADLQYALTPIGKPFSGRQLYILDDHLQPVPLGVVGELCIGGAGLARGYLKRSELTAEKFLPNPFSQEAGGRLYRTGDLARYGEAGEIEFLGRLDQQVKVRGFRIELGEIEAVLNQHPKVQDSVVIARDNKDNEKQLVAYVVANQEPVPTVNDLRGFLQQYLPDYMLPSIFIMLNAMPVTANGKLDRQALPDPDYSRPQLEYEFTASRTPIEEALSEIYAQVLRLERIGIHDNFFDLGGHSLLVTQAISRIREIFQVELPLRRFFESPTVAQIAEKITDSLSSGAERKTVPLVAVTRTDKMPASFAQQRLWFLDQLEPGSCFYNIPRAMRISGDLQVPALAQSINEVVRRHESLRTCFQAVDGTPMQIIAAFSPQPLPIADLSSLPHEHRLAEAKRLAEQQARQPFDLSIGPLFRAFLVKLDDADHLLLLTMHHIISDGWSLGVLMKELGVLYDSYSQGHDSPLAELPIQYADYAVWQRQWLQGEVLEEQLGYWRQQLAGAPAVLELPTDRPRPPVQNYRGAYERAVLPKELCQALQELSRREGVTLFMSLLAAFQILLSRYSGQEDIIVGTDVANRTRIETEGLIGFFVNLLAIRTDLSGNPTFKDLLRRVKKSALGAYAHQDVPFEKIVEELRIERNLSRNPLVQILLIMQNSSPQVLDLPGLTLKPFEISSETSRFDLAVFISETAEGLIGTWLYNRDLFDTRTIIQMKSRFETLLTNIVAQADDRIKTFEMLNENERRQQAMDQGIRQESQIKKLKNIKRKAIDLSQVRGIKTAYLRPEETLPLVIQPDQEGVDLIEWTRMNRQFIEEELLKYGAILFRNFDISSVSTFEQFASGFCPELFGEYGDLPREEIGGKVYGSTPYPADKFILFHNESSHLHCWPMKIWFYCLKAAEQGGETPILDCRKVYKLLNPKLKERFIEKKLMYVRNYTDGLDVSWQSFFRTTDRAVVENSCRKAAIDFEWKKGNSLQTRQICPAIVNHPKTGEAVFFNQIQLHHVSCLEPAVRESLLSMLKEEDLPRNVYYGDGSPIEDSVIEEISDLYRSISVSFPWKQRDILMLNNMLVAHSRNPYVGARKIVVAMGEMINKEEIQ